MASENQEKMFQGIYQNVRDPNQRWAQIYDAKTGTTKQYLLTKGQFAQLQNAGVLNVQEVINPRLDWVAGNLDSFDTLKNELSGSMQIGNDLLQKFDVAKSAPTTGAKLEYADNPTAQQDVLSRAYGGYDNMVKALGQIPNTNTVQNITSGNQPTYQISGMTPTTTMQGQNITLVSPEGNSFTVPIGSASYNNMIGMGYKDGQAKETAPISGVKFANVPEFQTYTKDLTKQFNNAGIFDINIINKAIEDNFISRSGVDIFKRGDAPTVQSVAESLKKPTTMADVSKTSTPSYDNINVLSPTASSIITDGSTQQNLDSFQNFTNNYLTGVSAQINKLMQAQQAKTAELKSVEEKAVADAEKGLTTQSQTDLVQKYKDELTAQGYKENADKLSGLMTEIASLKESLSLGLSAEGQRVAPLSIIGRRQQVLQEQGVARIGALTAIAEVYQGNMTNAKAIADNVVNLLNTQTQNQISAYEKLLDFHNDKLVSLTKQEQDFLNYQIELLQEQEKEAKANVEIVMDLILKYPDSAQKGGVSLTDSKETAMEKMQPYLAEEQASSRWTKLNESTLFNSSTGETKTVSEQTLNTTNAGNVGGECGTFSRSQYESIAGGNPMGDTLQSKKNWVDTYGTVGVNGLNVGDLVITDGSDVSKSGSPLGTGHALIVKGFDSNGNIIAYESNRRGDGVITDDRTLPIDSKAIYGYVRGTLKKGLIQEKGLTPTDKNKLYQITRDYKTNPIKMGYEKARLAANVAQSAKDNPKNAAKQLSLLYSYVKNLDSDSAVKEGETELAQSISSYMDKFKVQFEKINKNKLLSDDVALQIADETISLFENWKGALERTKDEFRSQSNILGLVNEWDSFIEGTGEQKSNINPADFEEGNDSSNSLMSFVK